MAKFTVFYKNQIEEECDDFPNCMSTGTFVRVEDKDGIDWWRAVAWNNFIRIKSYQVPDNYKAMCLLLNLPI